MHYYTDVLKKYADFTGRATRKEFWMFILINIIISIVIGMIDGNTVLSGIYALAMVVPNLAVGARRLHDINKSGWWQLLSLIPFVGVIILIVFFALDGVNEGNRYGSGEEKVEEPKKDSEPKEEVIKDIKEEETEEGTEVVEEKDKKEVEENK